MDTQFLLACNKPLEIAGHRIEHTTLLGTFEKQAEDKKQFMKTWYSWRDTKLKEGKDYYALLYIDGILADRFEIKDKELLLK